MEPYPFHTIASRHLTLFTAAVLFTLAYHPASALADEGCEYGGYTILHPRQGDLLAPNEHFLLDVEGCLFPMTYILEKDSGETFELINDNGRTWPSSGINILIPTEPIPDGQYTLTAFEDIVPVIEDHTFTVGAGPTPTPQTPTVIVERVSSSFSEERNRVAYNITLEIQADDPSTVAIELAELERPDRDLRLGWTPTFVDEGIGTMRAYLYTSRLNETSEADICIRVRTLNAQFIPSEYSETLCITHETIEISEEDPEEGMEPEDDGEEDNEEDDENNQEEDNDEEGDEGQGEDVDEENAGCSTSMGSSTGSLGGPLLLLMLFVGLGRRRRDPRG